MNQTQTTTTKQESYANLVYGAHKVLKNIKCHETLTIDGEALDIPSVVAVSRYEFFDRCWLAT